MPNIVQSHWLSAVNGTWTTPIDWSGDVTPNDSNINEYDISIGAPDTSGADDFTVTTTAKETIGSLDVTSANATLLISKNIFTVYSKVNSYSDASNAGTIDVAKGATLVFGATGSPSNNSSQLWNSGSLILAGHLLIDAPWFGLYGPTGSFTLSGGFILASATAASTFDNIDETIAGSGAIGDAADLLLTNAANGVINANAAAALTINTGANPIQNAGLIETTGAGGLILDSAMQLDGQLTAAGKGALKLNAALVSGGGEIDVQSTGTMILHKSQLNISGAISIDAGGILSTTAGDLIGVNLHNVLAGDAVLASEIDDDDAINVVNNSTLNLSGTLFGTGGINLQSNTLAAKLEVFDGGLTLDNSGALLLSNNTLNSVVSNGIGEQLTDNTALIEGAGVIGDTWLRLVESPGGLIIANASAGLTIVADTAAVAAKTESANYLAGVVETTGAGGLTLQGGTLANAGTLEARGAGALTFSDEQLNTGGGVVETVGSGSIVLAGNSGISNQAYLMVTSAGSVTTTSGDVSDQILGAVFVSGAVDVVAGSTLIADGQWVGAGSINIQGFSGAATLEVAAGQVLQLTGKGALNMQGADSAIVSAGAGTVLQNSGDTISGAGTIGDANMTINNTANGKIDATGATALILNSTPYNSGTNSTYIYNSGILQSESAAGLTIEQAIYSPGKMIANSGSAIVAEGAVSGNGTATLNGTGSVQYDAANSNDVYFATGGAGTLISEDSAGFDGAIWGFAADDTIDLGDFAYVAGSTRLSSSAGGFGPYSGSLVVNNGASNSSPLTLEGNYTSANLESLGLVWQFSSDGHEIGSTGSDGTLVRLVAGH